MTAISDLLSSMRIGAAVNVGPIFAAPVFAEQSFGLAVLTLDEALEQHGLLVQETSEQGSVSELVADNRSDCPVFLLDGEQVLGLKQNRTFNLSMILPPNRRTSVPVTCLERGRWSARASGATSSEHVHFASGRAMKMRSVSESLREQSSYRSDQMQVWSDIEAKLDNSYGSPTAAEADFYSARKDEVHSLAVELTTQPKQIGVIVGSGIRLTGFDLFGSSELFARLHPKVVRSYLLDATNQSASEAPPPPELMLRELHAVLSGNQEVFDAPGVGETHRWTAAAGHAAALVVDKQCVHAAGFWNS